MNCSKIVTHLLSSLLTISVYDVNTKHHKIDILLFANFGMEESMRTKKLAQSGHICHDLWSVVCAVSSDICHKQNV